MSKRGHALVEFVFGVSLLAFLFQGLVVFCRVGLARERTLAFSRFGTSLLSSGALSEERVAAELDDYRSKMSSDPFLHWDWANLRYRESPASVFYDLVGTKVVCRDEHPFWHRLGLVSMQWEEWVVCQRGERR